MKFSTRIQFSLIFLLCISLFPNSIIFSQINKLDENNLEETMRNPWKADRSVFITDWLVLGPIPVNSGKEIDKDFLSGGSGEANVRPAEGQNENISGIDYKWKKINGKDAVDLQKYYQGGRNEDAIAYAYAKINREKSGKVYFYLGSDDGIKAWLNGKQVHRVLKDRGLQLDEDYFEGEMTEGENHLLMKIQQSKGGWGYAVRMMENKNQLNFIMGNIEFSLAGIDRINKTINVLAKYNLNQKLMKQSVKMEVYTVGGKNVENKTFYCTDPVRLNYKNWNDGPYEFRFTYEDVKGTKFVKYTSWYKGNILSAARKVVSSAPGRAERTPEASLHRMLADMILYRLNNNLENPDSSVFPFLISPLMEFDELKSVKQTRAGGFVRLAYIDDVDNAPQFCKCYLPLNYDPSKKWPMVVYLHGYIQNIPEYYRVWDIDRRHSTASDNCSVIFIEPFGRGNTAYTGIGDRDVLKCIGLAKEKFNVDDERVYLTGSSMGGYGTWNVATRHPDLFAAIAPVYGGGDYHVNITKERLAKLSEWETYLNDKLSSTAQMESLLNIPILVSHGDQDQSVNVNLSRYLVRMLQRWNYNVRYIEVPGKGHADLGLGDQIINWLLKYKRNPAPKHIRIRAADIRNASAYWAKVMQKENPREFVNVDAEVLEDNIIRVDSKNAAEVRISLPGNLIDTNKKIKIVWNGKIIEDENHLSKEIILNNPERSSEKLYKRPEIAGPIADYQNTPYMIVIGTISKDSVMKKIISDKAKTMINDWKSSQKYEQRYKNDTDVTDADMKKYSLYLLGGPEDNKITEMLVYEIPFNINRNEIIIDGKSFKSDNAFCNAIYPSPFNRERYIVIAASNSSAGFYFFEPRNGEISQYDFYITDGKIPNYSEGAKNEKILVASGFFGNNWEVNSSYVVEGNQDLRAKCAYTVLKDNLTPEVISSGEPSDELLNAYSGIYQLEQGPQIKIFLENGKLKASQLPGSQSFELTPVSEKEFFISGINVSLAFGKDSSGNYLMTVYQTGNEASLKKIE